MEVGRLPISAAQKGKLISAGYTTLSSISSLSPTLLSRDLNISETDALEIIKHASLGGTMDDCSSSRAIIGAQTAWDVLHEEESATRITTSSVDLDHILGGGISCCEVTEIGKITALTSLIQLAVNVQIPVHCGGLGGKAIYIDTEGSFMVERVLQIAQACAVEMSTSYASSHNSLPPSHILMQPEDILENIIYFRVCSYTEQIALVNYLDKFISEHREVKLVIIDSITFHFRQDFDDLALRTRLLGGMALKLMKLAKKFVLAVVLLNQVTTKYTEGSFQLSLALGDSWSHACTNRIILYWNCDERYAYIDKSPSLRSTSAPYAVTSSGIRNSVSKCQQILRTQAT
ncbi:hypothetical protein SAY86_013103 [Trapa natans]|uniref:DNA repair protein RAD51 homolog 3 n=1 Tax=Trapa natans TaxID=22666 RepID=A0AAN7R7T6_TRANT|nr:hypothetical protein SAY86_013103 [Trapa natans]